MSLIKEYFGGQLYKVGCVQFAEDGAEGFTLKVHDKHKKLPKSPFYLDLRLLMSHPLLLNDAASAMVETLSDLWSQCDLVSDLPTASTPFATLVSQKTRLPMISPRLAEKVHGIPGKVVGKWKRGQRVVLLDDLRTTGGSKEEAIALYDEFGLNTIVVGVLVDCGMPEGAPVAGRPFRSVFKWSRLLINYRAEQKITAQLYGRAADYPEVVARHLASCQEC
jgi:uridine monophosphate synthetase